MTPAIRSRVMNRAEFRAWLLAQPESAVVGTMTSVTDCPLARFAGRVVPSLTEWEDAWVVEFISGIDLATGQPVTREMALAVLDEVRGGNAVVPAVAP